MPEFILDHGSPEGSQTFAKLSAFAQGYVEAMFFTNTGTSDDGDLENASVAELSPEALERIIADCAAFEASAAYLAWSDHEDFDPEQAGQDYWYTRNGHDYGFWSGDYPKPHASALEAQAGSSQVDVYRGDDGLIYLG